jgi:hypothetical protein
MAGGIAGKRVGAVDPNPEREPTPTLGTALRFGAPR